MSIRLNEELANSVASGDIQTLYNHFRLIALDNPDLEDDRDKVSNGIRLKFNIQYALKKRFTEKQKQGIIHIQGKKYKVDHYWEELELRQDIMRMAIYENMKMAEITKPRTKLIV